MKQASQLTDYERKSLAAFEKSIHEGKWSNDGLLSMLKLLTDDYLNLQRVSTYATEAGKSTQWIRKINNPVKIAGVQFVIDNQ